MKAKNLYALLGICILAFVGSCGNDTAFNSGANPIDSANQGPGNAILYSDLFVGGTANRSRPVDVSFIVDTSGSMNEEKAQLELYMASFVSLLLLNSNLDYQVFMIGTNFRFPDIVNINPKFMRVNKYVDSWNGLAVATEYLSGTHNERLSMRKDAVQYLIFVTDDNSRMKAVDFEASVSNLGVERISVNGVVGLTGGRNSPTCTVDAVGSEYITLANMEKFSGVVEDVCTNDWLGLLERLATKVAASSLISEFVLAHKPIDQKILEVNVNGKILPENEYSYDSAKNAILFNKGSEPKENDAIVVTYYK